MNKLKINEENIRLDSFLKFAGCVDTGGRAKMVIQEGYVTVNGEVCTQRGRKIKNGDSVGFSGEIYVCEAPQV